MISTPFGDLKFPSKWGIMVKLGAILFLVLLLQIPLLLVGSVRSEREGLRSKAISEVGMRWGGSQKVLGPVLAVPYTFRQLGNPDLNRAVAFFLPENLELKSSLSPEVRARGIYQVPVYTAELSLQGRFGKLDWKQVGVEPISILWAEAWVFILLEDNAGLRAAPDWEVAGTRHSWAPGTRWSLWPRGIHASVPWATLQAEGGTFSIQLKLAGSGSFLASPVGRSSSIELSSNWPDPSFTGRQLPEKRSVDARGFSAQWASSFLARGIPQQWTYLGGDSMVTKEELLDSFVGVNLMPPTDAYKTTERALKHGMLFITLVFAAFFVFELSGSTKLSVFNYVLVGASLCLFFLGLLAMSEFVSYALAYWIPAAASIALVGSYCAAVFRARRRALWATLGLLAVYGYLYFVLQMQDYALLAGTAALFLTLAAVMWVTRRLGSEEKTAVT